jgi:DNA-binding GntR family transcriptional regulator
LRNTRNIGNVNGSPRQAATRLQPKSLGGEIVEILQREIIAGKFQPGQRLTEKDLIQRFGVSSIPVREALHELEARGLVVRHLNRGCSVIELTRKEVERSCELRRVLETRMVEWAAQRITPQAVEQLWSQFRHLEAAAESEDLSEFFEEDLKLHGMIWAIADNVYAAHALGAVLGSLFASGVTRSRAADTLDLKSEVEKHRRLVQAICDSDPQRAALSLLEIAAGFEKQLN